MVEPRKQVLIAAMVAIGFLSAAPAWAESAMEYSFVTPGSLETIAPVKPIEPARYPGLATVRRLGGLGVNREPKSDLRQR
jgi:hypothetical protein